MQSDNPTMFYKNKLKIIKFVMMLYCFTELNIKTPMKEIKPHRNKDYELLSCGQ